MIVVVVVGLLAMIASVGMLEVLVLGTWMARKRHVEAPLPRALWWLW